MPRHTSKRLIRRIGIALVGSFVTGLGVILWVSPIPLGIVLIPTGLLILATEFVWARRLLHHAKTKTGPIGRALARSESAVKRGRKPRWARTPALQPPD